MEPDFFLISMFPSVPLEQTEVLNQLLDVFESFFAPTHWGNDERIRVDYNRAEIIERVSRCSGIFLYRDKPAKYNGYFDTYLGLRSFLEVKFEKSLPHKHWPVFFEFSDQIAEIAKPRYGVTNIFWSSCIPWSNEIERLKRWIYSSSQPTPAKLVPNGPTGVGLRNYFSNDILGLFSKNIFNDIPAKITELDWGGVRLDLMDKPWEADEEKLLENWRNVMQHLETAHVLSIPQFQENNISIFYEPNTAWRKYLENK